MQSEEVRPSFGYFIQAVVAKQSWLVEPSPLVEPGCQAVAGGAKQRLVYQAAMSEAMSKRALNCDYMASVVVVGPDRGYRQVPSLLTQC